MRDGQLKLLRLQDVTAYLAGNQHIHYQGTFEDDLSFPKVGYLSSLECKNTIINSFTQPIPVAPAFGITKVGPDDTSTSDIATWKEASSATRQKVQLPKFSESSASVTFRISSSSQNRNLASENQFHLVPSCCHDLRWPPSKRPLQNRTNDFLKHLH